MNLWTDSPACLGKRHCRICRTPSASGWRRSLARAFLLPEDNVNFPCPHGEKWLKRFRGNPPVEKVPAYGSEPGQDIPTWDQLQEKITKVWPPWLPEFLESRKKYDREDCRKCESVSRRRRWDERISECLKIAGSHGTV